MNGTKWNKYFILFGQNMFTMEQQVPDDVDALSMAYFQNKLIFKAVVN